MGRCWQETRQEAGGAPAGKTAEATGASPLPPSFPQAFREHSEGSRGPPQMANAQIKASPGTRGEGGISPGSSVWPGFSTSAARRWHGECVPEVGLTGLPGHRAGPGAPGPPLSCCDPPRWNASHTPLEGGHTPSHGGLRQRLRQPPGQHLQALPSPSLRGTSDLPLRAGATDPPLVTTESRACETGWARDRHLSHGDSTYLVVSSLAGSSLA